MNIKINLCLFLFCFILFVLDVHGRYLSESSIVNDPSTYDQCLRKSIRYVNRHKETQFKPREATDVVLKAKFNNGYDLKLTFSIGGKRWQCLLYKSLIQILNVKLEQCVEETQENAQEQQKNNDDGDDDDREKKIDELNRAKQANAVENNERPADNDGLNLGLQNPDKSDEDTRADSNNQIETKQDNENIRNNNDQVETQENNGDTRANNNQIETKQKEEKDDDDEIVDVPSRQENNNNRAEQNDEKDNEDAADNRKQADDDDAADNRKQVDDDDAADNRKQAADDDDAQENNRALLNKLKNNDNDKEQQEDSDN